MQHFENSTTGHAIGQAQASKPRPQSEVERINNRLAELVGHLYGLRNRIHSVADHVIDVTVPLSNSIPNIEPVSSNTQHFIVDLEKAIDACGDALSRLDNQGT
jgi:hypothetical protein